MLMPVIPVEEKTLVTPPRVAVTTPSESTTDNVSAEEVPLSVSFPLLTLATLVAAVFALIDIEVAPNVGVNATALPALKLLLANVPVLLAYLRGVKFAAFAGLKPPVR